MPDWVGVPLIVNTPLLNEPETPVGKVPEVMEALVPPPPTRYVIVVIALLIQTVCPSVPIAEERFMVELLFTVIVPLKATLLHGHAVVTV